VKNGWTGGQYSVFRILFALYLLVHFAALLPWGRELFSNAGALVPAEASPLAYLFPNVLAFFDQPAAVLALLVVAALATIPLALGTFDRAAAVVLWYCWACLFGRNPLISNPSLPFVGWLLLAHAFLPGAPYGSWKAKGRADPDGGWRMPDALFGVAWIVMALGYTYSGATKLVSPSWIDGTALARVLGNPLARPGSLRDTLVLLPPILLRVATWGSLALELGFAPAALFRRLRPFAWLAMVAMHLGLLVVIDFADLTFGMLVLHLFTFDPAWIRPKGATTETLFYDGHCALCHGLVRFVVAEDRAGALRFAPLQSEAFTRDVPEAKRKGVPDSVVLLAADGELLIRSAAVLHVLARLGGIWRIVGAVVHLVPGRLRDPVYDAIASVRFRIFGRKEEACPIIPSSLRSRFILDG
jgi:predicted DCC family thiol-disulfide oxidoreductase YuxK